MEKSEPVKLNKQQSGTVIALQQGKLPPQALDLEEAVIGAMMIDKKGVDEVIDILQPCAMVVAPMILEVTKGRSVTNANESWVSVRL